MPNTRLTGSGWLRFNDLCLPLCLPLVFSLFLSGCIGSKRIDPAVNFNAASTQTILAAEESRNEAVRTLGELLERGVLPITAEEKIKEVDARFITALEKAKSVLSTFIQSGGSKSPIHAALGVLNAVVAELMEQVAEGGIQ